MNTSETLTNLLPALLAAKKAFKPALKTAENPVFRSKYVDFHSVVGATEEALQANDLMVIQTPTMSPLMEEKVAVLTTRLFHISGEWIEDTVSLPAAAMGAKDREGNPTVRYDAQTVGSAITYARRYSYMGILGIAPEDDDGNVAAAHAGPQRVSQPQPTSRFVKPAPRPAAVNPAEALAQRGIATSGEEYDDPLFDENGDIVASTKVPPPAQPRYEPPSVKPASGPTISAAQAKRWFAICKQNEKTEEEMRGALSSIGVKRSADIPKDQYDTFIEWAGGKNEARA